MTEDYLGSDILSEEDLLDVEKNHAAILDELHEKIRTSDAAQRWLKEPLGKELMKYMAADKLRQMKICSTSKDEAERNEAQIEYAAIRKLEVIFGTVITDGVEALNTLNNQHTIDN